MITFALFVVSLVGVVALAVILATSFDLPKI
jgi:hypothetical protein